MRKLEKEKNKTRLKEKSKINTETTETKKTKKLKRSNRE